MGVLFLDPITLVAVLALGVYVWVLWRGHFRRWFGTGAPWSVVAWPLPVVLVLVPLVADIVLWVVERLGVVVGDGIGGAAVYLAVYGLPAVLLLLWPPIWLLPRWARDRVTGWPRAADPSLPPDAMAAVHGRRGHASWARWAWQIDGVGGHVWLEGTRLRFKAADATQGGDDHRFALADEDVAQFRFSSDAELSVDRPRGGLWTTRYLDIELRELDGVELRGRCPWQRSGVLLARVVGRGSVSLVVEDVGQLRSWVREALDPPPRRSTSP